MYRVFSGGFSVTEVKCYVSVQVTYLLDNFLFLCVCVCVLQVTLACEWYSAIYV